MNTTAAYMDTLDWVERYAWFGYFVGFFVNYTFTLNNGYFCRGQRMDLFTVSLPPP